MAFIYELFCRILALLVLRGRRDRSKDVEILVLRKQLEVLTARSLDRDFTTATARSWLVLPVFWTVGAGRRSS